MTALTAQLRSETQKFITSRSTIAVLASMVGLIALAVALHAFGLSVQTLSSPAQQRGIMVDVGSNIGSVFGALLGALMITSEFRTGTIRPTLLASPRRARVYVAKTAVALVLGAVAGALATATAAGVATAGLTIRDIEVQVTAGDVVQLLLGEGVGAALWAVIGLAIGALVRAQVPSIIGLFTWILFVENILTDLPKIHRFAPAALAQTLAGQTRDGFLTSIATAAMLLGAYAALVAVAGAARFHRQDVA